MKKSIITILMGTVLLFAQGGRGPRTIPPVQNDPTHKGQPNHCQNYDTKEWKKNCSCTRECTYSKEDGYWYPDGHPHGNCKTHCRTSQCRCRHTMNECDQRRVPEKEGEEQ